MIVNGLEQMAATFWEACGLDEERVPYPRDLLQPILYSMLPLDVEDVAGLHLRDVLGCAARMGFPLPDVSEDRPLRASVLAWHGEGLVMLDSGDTAAERRFSLAHEAAHFLCEYYLPRRRCIEALGEASVAVMDGARPPTRSERATALLAGARLGVHAHFMERESDGTATDPATDAAEERADALAMSLLAPSVDVWEMVTGSAGWTRARSVERQQRTTRLLCDTFGLPPGIAHNYAKELLTRYHSGPTVREWLES